MSEPREKKINGLTGVAIAPFGSHHFVVGLDLVGIVKEIKKVVVDYPGKLFHWDLGLVRKVFRLVLYRKRRRMFPGVILV